MWIVGGDGWAYDIGFGGLDHVIASGANVNILVLDTEVYSNTGGQASEGDADGRSRQVRRGRKPTAKKDLGTMATKYANVYVAQVAMGASDTHTVKAFLEAEAHEGPSLIIAYSQCIAHGIDISKGMHHQKLAVELRLLAALPLQPGPRRRGSESVPVGLRRSEDSLRKHLHRRALPDAATERPGRRQVPARSRAVCGQLQVESSTEDGQRKGERVKG